MKEKKKLIPLFTRNQDKEKDKDNDISKEMDKDQDKDKDTDKKDKEKENKKEKEKGLQDVFIIVLSLNGFKDAHMIILCVLCLEIYFY